MAQDRVARDRGDESGKGGMKGKAFNATLLFYPKGNPKLRLFALWYFTTLMIVWNILGHSKLGLSNHGRLRSSR